VGCPRLGGSPCGGCQSWRRRSFCPCPDRPSPKNGFSTRARRTCSASNFPTEPQVQDLAYTSEFNLSLPAHVYSAASGQKPLLGHRGGLLGRRKKLHAARAAQCKKDGGESDACTNDFRADVQGSIVNASWRFIQRNTKVTYFAWAVTDNNRRPAVAAVEPRWIENLRSNLPARHAAVHPGGNRAEGRAGSWIVSSSR